MSAYTGTQSHAGSNFLILLGIVGALFLCALTSAVPMEQAATDTASAHAVERHGTDAQVALDMVNARGDCHICADGRQRCTASQGNQWAVVVKEFVDGAWRNVTAFLCDQDYAVSVKDDCDPRWRGAVHP